MSKVVYTVGQKVNAWTIIESPMTGKITGQCACGIVRTKWAYSFKDNMSCGSCAQKNRAARIDPLVLVIRKQFSNYKASARSDNREFELSFEEFWELILNDCKYCGDAPSRAYVKQGIVNKVNGVDRIDSSRGYTADNTVSCCTICNMMKRDLPIDIFEQQVSKIYVNLNVQEVKND